MLRLEGCSYRHAGARAAALLDINLAVADAEVLGVVGPNESGKSTLAFVLAGLAPRVIGGEARGRVLVDGTDVADLAMHELPARVGIVFDNPATQLSGVTRTVFEEVAFGPANLGVPLEELLARTASALDALGIGELAERDPARLSGGQQQLVAIASILAMRPKHIVLDEPTAQLDPAGTSLVGNALERLARTGIAIVLIEHKTDVLARVAHRVVVLESGRIAFDGPAADVLRDSRVPGLGVAPPSDVRLRRRLQEAGLDAALAGLPA